MTWEEPWSDVDLYGVMGLKMKGEHLKIPPLDSLPGTDEDIAAFTLVAAQYTDLIQRVRLRSEFHSGVCMQCCTLSMCCLLASTWCVHMTAAAAAGRAVLLVPACST